ncbi:MAG: undecaprenyldiphospho-muramoylpentapeptide beta-N-acetylglucosaminyltransferase [Psychromonas sp.]|nr:undecaprenyldiphospho-muramoylpentapeptide beta-N-acetylglucosaminyltransferase [Psychromonas sp.]
MNCKKTLLVMAGGTGGHVFPGLCVADKLKAQGWQVSWLGTKDKMEAQLVPKHGYEIDFIDISGIRNNGIIRLVFAPFRIIKSIIQARAVLKKRNVNLVIGMGGFASGPGGIAAWMLGIPVLLHEQNAAAGLTNRLLAPFCKKILMGFDGAFNNDKALLVGNPVRESLLNLSTKKISSAKAPLKILIVGGSLGAKVLNDLLPIVMKELDPDKYQIIHQSGKGHFKKLQNDYLKYKINVQVREFIDDMDVVYDWADLVVCRAGALTVAEVAIVGLPAIFVPLPHAVDDHQTKNAQNLVVKQAAILIAQKDLNKGILIEYLIRFSCNKQLLVEMSNNCKAAAMVDATLRIASVCEKNVSFK